MMVCAVTAIAQPGIYSEQDITTQNLYMDAQLAKLQGKTEEQITTLKEILKRDKACHACHYEISKAQFLLTKNEQALSSIKKALSIQSSNEWYLLFQADIQEKLEQFGDAANTLTKLISIQDNNPALYHRLALQQLSSNQPDQAILTLEKWQQRNGVDEETSRRLFKIHSTTGDEKKAIATLNKLIDSDTQNTRYLNNLASYYKELGNEKEAKKIYEEILKVDPNNSKASFALLKKKSENTDGIAYLNDLEKVIANMNLPLDNKIQELIPFISKMQRGSAEANQLQTLSEQLIELYPSDAKVYSVHGDINYYNGDHAVAYKNYKQAIKIDDRKYILWLQYLSSIWELADHKSLLSESEKAMDLYPNNVETYLYHAIALAENQKASDASNILTEAGFIAGKNEKMRAKINVIKNWVAEGKADMELMSDIDLSQVTSPTYLELMGDIYQRNNDRGTAEKYWKRAIELGANENRINSKIPIK